MRDRARRFAHFGAGPLGPRARSVHGMETRNVFARARLDAVWLENHANGAGDSVRRSDQGRAAAKWDRVFDAVSSETRTEDDIEADLLEALGFPA